MVSVLCYNITMMIDDAPTLEIAPLSTLVKTHAHGHGHHHEHARDHDHAPAAFRPPFSLVRLSLGGRLAIALGLSAGVWLAVRWALMPIG
jgi:hypothetical protein